jgi:hypothetical protein
MSDHAYILVRCEVYSYLASQSQDRENCIVQGYCDSGRYLKDINLLSIQISAAILQISVSTIKRKA